MTAAAVHAAHRATPEVDVTGVRAVHCLAMRARGLLILIGIVLVEGAYMRPGG
ncbi:MAG: hypothetical protein ACRDGE_06230 [Candidatus Limnocylindria bacterium]